MDLTPRARRVRDKLRRAHGVSDPDRNASDAVRGDVRDLLARRARRQRERRPRVELPPEGREASNDGGPFHLRELRYDLGHRHGLHALGLARDASFADLAVLAKDEAAADVALGDCLFVDTETTGLSGGAGTTVFMTGMAWVEADAVVLEQTFLRSFADEAGALAHVAKRLADHPVLVSFVGKSFDRHRLAARMTVHKLDAADELLTAPHLDLYWMARRRWAGELPNTKLRTVEEERLGFVRDDDLPGSEAPRAFLDWLRDGTGPIDQVFEHNRLDVLSLVTLLGVLGTDRPDALS